MGELEGFSNPVAAGIGHLALISASALLFLSGAAKLASPTQVAAAVAELGARRQIGVASVRVLAAGEIVLGSFLVVPALPTVVGLAILAFGTGLAFLGAIGVLRHASKPCGCFGNLIQKPIGWATVGAGILFAACGLVLLRGYGTQTWDYAATTTAPLASFLALLLTFGSHRNLIRNHFTLGKWRSADGGQT